MTDTAAIRPDEPFTPAQRRPAGGGVLQLPVMGLGTWAWGDKATWGMNGYDSDLSFETIRGAYRASVAAGITLLDTAEVYGDGESERIIARLMKEEEANSAGTAGPTQVPTHAEIVVATKFMPFPWKLALKSSLMASLRASLERLQMPRVHLYQIHGPISVRSHAAMADALAAAVEARLVQAVGVSNYSERELRALHRELAARGIPLATNQVEYSLLRTMPATNGLMAACRELGVVMLAYSPLAMGRLTGKYTAANPPPGRRNFSAFPMAEIEPVVAELRRLGERHGGKSPSQVALNWIMCKGAVPIPGAKNERQAAQNAGALGWRLNEDEVAGLDLVSLYGQRRLIHRIWQHG